MQSYELLTKGTSGVPLTTNDINGNNLKIIKITENSSGRLISTDITETNPTIIDIANGTFKRYYLTVPDEDCYIFALFNSKSRIFRVGTPRLRIFGYFINNNIDVKYKLLDFDGNIVDKGLMDKLDSGIYYMTPLNTGDFIFQTNKTKPIPVHTPYVVDTVGMSGKIVFQKNKWMLLAVPKENTKISDIVSDIESKYSINGCDVFDIFSAYPATVSQSSEMLDYKPGVTPVGSKYNFSLVYKDGKAKEITGFWCKVGNYDLSVLKAGKSDELITYEWSA